MENILQRFSWISFWFKPPWIYSHFTWEQNLKITDLILGNNFSEHICNATVTLINFTRDALLDRPYRWWMGTWPVFHKFFNSGLFCWNLDCDINLCYVREKLDQLGFCWAHLPLLWVLVRKKKSVYQPDIYLFKVNNGNTGAMF